MEGLTYVRDTETRSLDFLRKDLFSSHSQKEELPSLPAASPRSQARGSGPGREPQQSGK